MFQARSGLWVGLLCLNSDSIYCIRVPCKRGSPDTSSYQATTKKILSLNLPSTLTERVRCHQEPVIRNEEENKILKLDPVKAYECEPGLSASSL